MPARRSGHSATKSTSHRLCARMPASRCSYSSGLGGRANNTKLGKNGGTVFGNNTSATTPSDSCCSQRTSESQLRARRLSRRSLNGFLYLPRHASKSSWYFDSRYSRYCACEPPQWLSAVMIVYLSVALVAVIVPSPTRTSPASVTDRPPSVLLAFYGCRHQ